MRNIMKLSVIFLGLGLFFIGSTPSYADHVRVGVNIGVPIGGYYYGDPYYYGAPYYYGNPYYPGYVVASSSSYQPVVINGTLIMLTMGRIIFTPNMAIRR